MDPVLTEANSKIQATMDHLKHELSGVRAGRANPSLIEDIKVEAYGEKMSLMEVGTISAPQPTLLTVQVWDQGIMQSVVKAIQEANLGLNPSFEGQVIRLPIPPLTAERRAEFIKVVHLKMEESKVAIRQIRQDIREGWEKEKEAGEIGEDEFNRSAKILQDLIEKTSGMIDELGKAKEEELSQI